MNDEVMPELRQLVADGRRRWSRLPLAQRRRTVLVILDPWAYDTLRERAQPFVARQLPHPEVPGPDDPDRARWCIALLLGRGLVGRLLKVWPHPSAVDGTELAKPAETLTGVAFLACPEVAPEAFLLASRVTAG